MVRLVLPLLACAALLPASEAKGLRHQIGPVLGSQQVEPGRVLEARAVNGQSGHVLIRWGDVADQLGKDAKPGAFHWSGSASAPGVRLIRTVLFEQPQGQAKAGRQERGDRIVGDGYAGSVAWDTRTWGHWDGVIVAAKPGSTLTIANGPARLSITVP
jgi:hypothetical protein